MQQLRSSAEVATLQGELAAANSAEAWASTRTTTTAPRATASAASSADFAHCTAARAAGAAPIRVGDPGCSRELDRDGDGVGGE